MPSSNDPPEGYIGAANQAVTDSQTPFRTTEWDYGYRSERIRTQITATPKVTPERMSQIQGDTTNGFAPVLIKALLAVNLRKDPFTQQGQALLRTWNDTEPSGKSPSAAEAANSTAVWSITLRLTFNYERGVMMAADGSEGMHAHAGLQNRPHYRTVGAGPVSE